MQRQFGIMITVIRKFSQKLIQSNKLLNKSLIWIEINLGWIEKVDDGKTNQSNQQINLFQKWNSIQFSFNLLKLQFI